MKRSRSPGRSAEPAARPPVVVGAAQQHGVERIGPSPAALAASKSLTMPEPVATGDRREGRARDGVDAGVDPVEAGVRRPARCGSGPGVAGQRRPDAERARRGDDVDQPLRKTAHGEAHSADPEGRWRSHRDQLATSSTQNARPSTSQSRPLTSMQELAPRLERSVSDRRRLVAHAGRSGRPGCRHPADGGPQALAWMRRSTWSRGSAWWCAAGERSFDDASREVVLQSLGVVDQPAASLTCDAAGPCPRRRWLAWSLATRERQLQRPRRLSRPERRSIQRNEQAGPWLIAEAWHRRACHGQLEWLDRGRATDGCCRRTP